MDKTEVTKLLDDLAGLRGMAETLRLDQAQARESILTPEIQDALAAIDEVLALGESVRGVALNAVYMQGRKSWDYKGVEGYAVAHPELFAYKKEGEPSVSIRGLK